MRCRSAFGGSDDNRPGRCAALAIALLVALAPAAATGVPFFREHANVPLVIPQTDKFGEPTGALSAVGGEAVAIFDVNRDGLLDAVIVTGDPYYNIVLQTRDADGTPRFVAQPPLPVGVEGDQRANRPAGLGVHDFDGDGLLDLYFGSPGRGGIRLRNPRPPFDLSPSNQVDSGIYRDAAYRTHLARGDGTFAYRDLNADGNGNTRSAVFADFDGDGYSDALLSNAPYFGIWWGGTSAPNQLRPGLADGSFGADIIDTAVINDDGTLWHDALGRANKDFKGVVVRDFDGDGRPDVILSAFSDIWDNVATPPIWTMDPAGALVDADGDGQPDGGYQGDWERGILVLHNVSTAGHIAFENVSATAIDNGLAPGNRMHTYVTVPADIDNDGDLDLLCSGPRYFFAHGSQTQMTDRVRVYRNDSVPGAVQFTNVTAAAGVDFMNDDAAIEAFTSGLYPISIPNVMLDGSAFTMTPLLSAATAFDLDNDGDVDWIAIDRQLLARNPLTGDEFSSWVFLNDGGGHFTPVPPATHGLIHTGRELSPADLDGDGRLDLVIVNDSGGGQSVDNNNYVFLNAVDTGNHWVSITTTAEGDRLGLGTKVTVYAAGTNTILGADEIRTDFAYRSKRPPVVHVGLGAAQAFDVRLDRPDGTTAVHRGLAADRRYTFRFGSAGSLCDGMANGACTPLEHGMVRIADGPAGPADLLVWSADTFQVGAQAFADPRATARYALCLYAGDPGALVAELALQTSQTCAQRPCWRPTANGYRYHARDRAPDGVAKALLSSRSTARTRVRVRGAGSLLPFGRALTSRLLPFPGSATMRLVNDADGCWESRFGDAQVNTAAELRAVQP